MKTTKGGKVMNPTDAYRKELRRKELKRNKKERKKVREVGILKKDPESIKEQIEKLEMMKADGALDKARKHKKRQLEDTYNMVLKKRKEYEDKMREKGETPVMFSHLGPLQKRSNTKEDENETQPMPEDSVYYHPTLNPTGAPPPGKPPMFKSSIGPRIPLPAPSTAGPSSSNFEAEDAALSAPPPPPPPLPDSGKLPSGDDLDVSSMPLPPLPPPPPKPVISSGLIPPPPPGPPPKGAATANAALVVPPPPQPLKQLSQPLPPGIGGHVNSNNVASEGTNIKEAKIVLPPPPPPPGLQSKVQSDAFPPVASTTNSLGKNDTNAKLIPSMPPPPPQGISFTNLRPEMIPHGMPRFPPPPPPHDMRPPLPIHGHPNRPSPPPPPGMAAPMPRPLFAVLPGPPSLLRLPVPTGHVVNQEDDHSSLRPPPPPRPSYVKSAASTVVKKPLAQHTPELTAMVPASVRVRRETALPKTKPKPLLTAGHIPPQTAPVTSTSKPETSNAAAAAKVQSIDDSYVAFLEDMKALGALDG